MLITSTTRTIAMLVAATPIFSQAPRPPQVNPDRTITFTLSAPNAKDVFLSGEFEERYNRPPGAPMVKGDNGVWTFTSAPVEPGTYYYGYVVDGLFTIDPANSRFRAEINNTPVNNVVEVPGGEPFVHSVTAGVPRGTVHIESMQSTALNRTVQFYVYTPAGYAASTSSYPALYLTHGSPGNAREWTCFGFADRILDNLIAAGKAREMVVVMLDSTIALPFGANNAAQQLASLELFEKYLTEEVIPFAEGRYRIQPEAATRWLGGFSRGGIQTFHTGLRRPNTFSALGVFSATLPATFPAAYSTLADGAKFTSQVHTFFYTCGRDDDRFAAFGQARTTLEQMGVRLDTASQPGGHIWDNWRNGLAEFVTKLQ